LEIANGQPEAQRQAQSDAKLLKLIEAGDEAAFVSLYRCRQRGIYRFALQMSGSTSVAEDVTQEVFMALIRDPRRYDPGKGSVASFLYGIARNHVLRRLGADRFFVQLEEDTGESGASTQPVMRGADDPLAAAARRELIDAVRRGILALPAHYREAVVLCDLHELSYDDAAGVLGCAVGTVRSRLHRARKVLAEKLRSAAGTGSASEQTSTARCLG
jgi:RNA polymerase sigma-70 factor (ECF subfamily)